MKKPARTRITAALTTTSLIETVAADTGMPREDVREVVMSTFDVVARAMASGHNVAVTNFGTWISYRTNKRKARNPQNGATVVVPAHQAMKFRTSRTLAGLVRRRASATASIRKAPKGSGGQ
ncbi:HU family DNA-binding protein [Streptomyces sp. NPDC001089]